MKGKTPSAKDIVMSSMGKWGKCVCGGWVLYYSDYGVRCSECKRLYGTWIENLKKSKEMEKQRRQTIAGQIAMNKFSEELLI